MAYFEDEIKKDLVLGEIYTSREISSLLSFSNVVVLCEDVSYFNDTSDMKFKVINKTESYIHRNENHSYHFSNNRSRVFTVKRVK
ncbi:hypothetical protein [Mesobacillus foraminis]|uniref:Uncharacterized protein n=1 Tax=Mesobacillus foraminis TaxID=279826 RepID=A0A4R2BEW4_9BACI|nr:hypothetical protein [Mesobacillus foraminis]TCN25498.1 hypothetical protein EV146_105155 [Mesobacillus foraminis]